MKYLTLNSNSPEFQKIPSETQRYAALHRFGSPPNELVTFAILEDQPVLGFWSYVSLYFRYIFGAELSFVFWPLFMSWAVLGRFSVEWFGVFAFLSVVLAQIGAQHLNSYSDYYNGKDWVWKTRRSPLMRGQLLPSTLLFVGLLYLLMSFVLGSIVFFQSPMEYFPPVAVGLIGLLLFVLPKLNRSVLVIEIMRSVVYGPILFWGLALFFKTPWMISKKWLLLGLLWSMIVLMYAGAKNLQRLLVLSKARQLTFFIRFGGFDRLLPVFLVAAAIIESGTFLLLSTVWGHLAVFSFVTLIPLLFLFQRIRKIRSPLSSQLGGLSQSVFVFAAVKGAIVSTLGAIFIEIGH